MAEKQGSGESWKLGKSVSKELWSAESKAAGTLRKVPFVFGTVWLSVPWKEQSLGRSGTRGGWGQEEAVRPFPYN